MKRLRVLSVVATLLMMSSFLFLSVEATLPANVTPGDTFIYTVSTWDVPWEELIPAAEAPFDLADFVFDLSGSTLGVKVMDTHANGYYMLDLYVILGNTIVIPLPDDTDPQIIDIFGTSFNLDEGVGIGLGSLPGSDMTELIAGTEDSGAVPFYLNPASWDTYQTELEALGSADATVTVTNVDGSDFTFAISGTADGVAMEITVAWFRDGDNAGVFKSISGTVDGDVTGDGVSNHLGIALSFDKKEVNVLPQEIRSMESMILSFSTAEFTHSVTGFSTALHDEIDDGLVYFADIVTDLNGQPVIQFDVQEVVGCYYNTRIEVYNPDTAVMEEQVSELWWNGFTGFQVYNTSDDFLAIATPYTQWSPSIALVPLLAPGITPDWDMWAASTISISQVNEIVEKSVEAFFKEQEVTDLGLDLNALDSVYQLRESGDTMFFYSESKLDLDFNVGQMEGATEAGIKSTAKLSVDFTSINWLAYTKLGLLAGAGVEVNADINVVDFPDILSTSAGVEETGSVSLNANIVLQSDQVSSIPDPEAADPIAGGNAGGDLIPGFEFVSSFMIMTTIVVLIKRKNRK
ncbi:MAG: hypothetical protein ACW98I_11700 [Candidatus Hodarchaeales archaeon]